MAKLSRMARISLVALGLLIPLAVLGAFCAHEQLIVPPATAQSFVPRMRAVTQNGATIGWSRVRNMRGVKIWISERPFAAGGTPVLLAELPASAASYELAELPPRVPAYLRLELDAPGGPQRAELEVTLPRGMRWDQTRPLRAAHLVTPSTVLVVLAGGDGEDWAEQGEWTVKRRNGSAISIRAVHRFSYPTGQPNFELGFCAEDSLELTLADHEIYLDLTEPIGEHEVLTLEGPDDLRVVLPVDDRRLETPVVQLNQVGYNPRATKRWAYVSGYLGDGGPLRLTDMPRNAEILRYPRNGRGEPEVIATVPLRTHAQRDQGAGGEVREIDLARMPASETHVYRIRLPGVGVSYPTQVSERAAMKAYYTVARGMFHNRYAGDLRASCTEWTRPPDHTRVFTAEQVDAYQMFPENTPQRAPRTMAGGHHDAGDFDIRPMHTVVPQLLMRAYEIAPARFTDRQLTIPESGNRIPDLLDEALWNIAGWTSLQESDGGVRGGVESWRHPCGYYFANEEDLPYWTFARNPGVTARMAGVFAQASRLVQPFDANEARDLRDRAERAYRWAKSHNATAPFLIYGASELFRLTGEDTYARDFAEQWRSFGPDGVFNAYALEHLEPGDYAERGRVMPDYIMGYLGSERADPELKRIALTWMDRISDDLASRVLESPHGHRNPRPADRQGLGWGAGSGTSRYLDVLFSRLSLGGLSDATRQRYFDALSVAADYSLGANPAGLVYITGLGTRSPEEPLHLDSLAWRKRGRPPVPGIPVYGPVSELPAAEYYDFGKREFHPAFPELPLLRRYADLRTFVTNNEFTVWELQAPYTEHFATLLGEGQMPPRSWLPNQPEHESTLP